MGETWGVSAVHIDVIRRIARRVRASSGAGRYIGIGSSAEMRERVLFALRRELGGDGRVVGLDLAESRESPWNAVRRLQQESGLVPAGRLFVAWGLRALSERTGGIAGEHPYAQLNLSRDAWASTGTHLLVWIDGLGEFDQFLRAAPDLWSHRDVVGWFLTADDFQPTTDGPPLVRRAPVPDGRPIDTPRTAWELDHEAEAAYQAGRPLDAARLARASRDASEGAHTWPEVWFHASLVLVRALCALGRADDAIRIAREAEALTQGQFAFLRLTSRQMHAFAKAGRGDGSGALQDWREILHEAGELEVADAARLNLAGTLVDLGAVGPAWDATLAGPGRAPDYEATTQIVRMRRSLAQGDATAAIMLATRVVHLAESAGFERVRLQARLALHAALAELGIGGAERGLGGDETAQLRVLRAAIEASPDGATDDQATRFVNLSSRLAVDPAGRSFAAHEWNQLCGPESLQVRPGSPQEKTLWDGLLGLLAECAGDPECEGIVRWALASFLASNPAARPRAWEVADGHLVRWSRRWRGPVVQAKAWVVLARVAPPDRAGKLGARAMAEADATPCRYTRIEARRVLANAAGDRAEMLLGEALAIARAEGLALQELDLLHDLSRLPGHPGAAEAAEAALGLASARFLPRQEARARIDLALLQSGTNLARRHLDRARELVDELGPLTQRLRLEAIDRG